MSWNPNKSVFDSHKIIFEEMKKSVERVSSDKSFSESGNILSFKRYFVNNLDSYHGEFILNSLSKILEKNLEASKEASQILLGEDVDAGPPPPPEQPYEIVGNYHPYLPTLLGLWRFIHWPFLNSYFLTGTVSDPKIKSLDNVARIIPKTECLPQMLTCGTVVFDISCDRTELKTAIDYLKGTQTYLGKIILYFPSML